MTEISLVINTISKNKDVWNMFFDKIKEHISDTFFENKYVFVDDDMDLIPEDYTVVKYDTNVKYKQQFESCISKVVEKYCIYVSEDYILYDNVDEQKIINFIDVLEENNSLSFVRFMRGGIYDGPFEKYSDNLYYVPNDKDYFYTNQAALWRTRNLEMVHKRGPNLHIANTDWQNSFEYQATKTCQELGYKGLFCYYGEEKRGVYHYDSSVFPHVSTALVKGKWNMSEYPNEMSKIISNYGLDIRERGWV